MSDRIEWAVTQSEQVGSFQIAMSPEIRPGYQQGCGIRRDTLLKFWLKRCLYPLIKFRNDLLVDGFLEREIARLIRRYLKPGNVFLEVGCGDLSVPKFLPRDTFYNGIDLEISAFHVQALSKRARVNLACALATALPVDSNSVDFIVSAETFEHIPEIDTALVEIHRTCKNNAILVCTIPNNHCYKYDCIGKNKEHINEWHYEEFISLMKCHGFDLVEGHMIGWWLPLSTWLMSLSCQLPISVADEYKNTNFIYAFRAKK